jgi:hypothetical protein
MVKAWMDVNEALSYHPEHPAPTPRKHHGDADVVDAGGLTRTQREVLGFVLRLDIPLDNSRNLRRYAEKIRGLADQLDFISRRTDLTEHQLLWEARTAAFAVRQHVREIYPTKSRILPPK